MSKTATLYFDGGARPTNPGRAGFASVLRADHQQYVTARKLGWKTNNVAEYHGLIVGLKMALDHDVTDLDIYTDSKLIEGHINKSWKVGPELRVYYNEANKLLTKFPVWTLVWIPRIKNKTADELCTKEILAQHKANPWVAMLAAKPRARAHTRKGGRVLR